MPFKRTIEIGRVALCNYGDDAGKLYVIVDVLDAARVCVRSVFELFRAVGPCRGSPHA